jgi:mono/diheme cytochrome c family protein
MTRSESTLVAAAGLLASALFFAAGPLEAEQASDRWQIPATASTEVNPVAVSDAVLAKGKQLYKSKCQRCHGPLGVGDGPDADPDAKPDDLTDSSRAARNPDGVLFYKMWNGRGKPKMPAFSTDLSREEVWTLVHYVKTLRK